MSKKFQQISLKSGFMKHNGGLFFRKISKTKFEFKTIIKKNHLNRAGITHGGYIASIIDAGGGGALVTSDSILFEKCRKFLKQNQYRWARGPNQSPPGRQSHLMT